MAEAGNIHAFHGAKWAEFEGYNHLPAETAGLPQSEFVFYGQE